MIFRSSFHVFSGTPPGTTFSLFYVDFLRKSTVLEPLGGPGGPQMATKMHRIQEKCENHRPKTLLERSFGAARPPLGFPNRRTLQIYRFFMDSASILDGFFVVFHRPRCQCRWFLPASRFQPLRFNGQDPWGAAVSPRDDNQ